MVIAFAFAVIACMVVAFVVFDSVVIACMKIFHFTFLFVEFFWFAHR